MHALVARGADAAETESRMLKHLVCKWSHLSVFSNGVSPPGWGAPYCDFVSCSWVSALPSTEELHRRDDVLPIGIEVGALWLVEGCCVPLVDQI